VTARSGHRTHPPLVELRPTRRVPSRMGRTSTEIDHATRQFIEAQHMFFVASAPTKGHINLSPKGLDTFRILGPRQVAYADYTGSGVETISHLRENGRLTIMFCAFDGSPNILRLYGTGRAVEVGDPEFASLAPRFNAGPGVRAIIVLDVTRVMDSCGFGVPLYDYRGERDQLTAWSDKKGEAGVREYQAKKNASSLDGLPGLKSATPSRS